MIIDATREDIPILNEFLHFFHTTLTMDALENDPYSHYLLYESKGEIIAMIGFAIMYERAELNYIYVKPEFRGSHISSLLLEEMIKRCKKGHVKSITLEVRSSNQIAQILYQNHGFIATSIRKKYYQDEDAILMEKKLTDDSED